MMEDGGDEAPEGKEMKMLMIHHQVEHHGSPIDRKLGIDAVEKANKIFRDVVEGASFWNDVIGQNPGHKARVGFKPSVLDR